MIVVSVVAESGARVVWLIQVLNLVSTAMQALVVAVVWVVVRGQEGRGPWGP